MFSYVYIVMTYSDSVLLTVFVVSTSSCVVTHGWDIDNVFFRGSLGHTWVGYSRGIWGILYCSARVRIGEVFALIYKNQESRVKAKVSQLVPCRMDIISIGLAFLLAGRLATQQTDR